MKLPSSPALPILYPQPLSIQRIYGKQYTESKDPDPFFLAWKACSIVVLLGDKSI